MACVRTLSNYGILQSICFDPVNGYLVTGSDDNTIKVWNVSSGECVRTLTDTGWVTSLCFDRGYLISGSVNTIKVWNVSTRKVGDWRCIATLNVDTHRINCVCFDSVSGLLASGSNDCRVRIWHLSTGECVRTLRHGNPVTYLCFHPTSGLLVSRSEEGQIKVWDLSTSYTYDYITLSVKKKAFGEVAELTPRETTMYGLLQTFLPPELAVMGL